MRMPRTWQRLVALAGMVGVAVLAGWLLLVASLAARGVFENQEPEDYARGRRLAVIAAVAAMGALISIVGLAFRRRVPAALGAVIVAACATSIFADWHANGWRLGRDDSDFAAALLSAIAVGVLAL
jgi:hypothetical protein